jgi:hypothetical protein
LNDWFIRTRLAWWPWQAHGRLLSIGTPSNAPLADALKTARDRRQEVIENALAQIH